MSVLIQRPLRGSRISSFYPIKSLPSLASLDSAFQLQEYISLLIRLDVHDVDTIVSVPGKEKEKSEGDEQQDKKSDVTVDEACWIYEQLRRLAQDLTHPLITMLQQECNRSSCPEMKAGEWLYLCVAHGNDGAMEQCCAIDYILHTLDSATALLNSPRAFPSRLQIPQTSNRHFSSLARRLGRIFAHAYFHHREAFEQAEAESSLYARFLALTSKFDLVPAEFLVIPPRMSSLNVDPPRLLGAAVNVEAETKTESEEGKEAGAEPETSSPPGLGAESPRKVGRNRTDTMILSDLYNAEEQPKPDPDTDKLALDLDKTESIH
ncbi:Mob1/phocein, partial [Mycena floridula]